MAYLLAPGASQHHSARRSRIGVVHGATHPTAPSAVFHGLRTIPSPSTLSETSPTGKCLGDHSVVTSRGTLQCNQSSIDVFVVFVASSVASRTYRLKERFDGSLCDVLEIRKCLLTGNILTFQSELFFQNEGFREEENEVALFDQSHHGLLINYDKSGSIV